MKRSRLRFILVLFLLAATALTILTVRVDLNLRIRRKIHPWVRSLEVSTPESPLYYLGPEGPRKAVHSAAELATAGEDTPYFHPSWLEEGLYTWQYSPEYARLDLAGPGHHIVIHDDGSVLVNGESSPVTIRPLHLDGEVYLPWESWEQLAPDPDPGLILHRDGEAMVFISGYLDYHVADLSRKTPIYTGMEELLEGKSRLELQNFYRIGSLFEPLPVAGEADGRPAFSWPGPEGTLQVFTESGVTGLADVNSGSVRENAFPASLVHPPFTPPLPEPVFLAWEAVYSRNPDPETIGAMPGVNVISPTWHALRSADGAMSSNVSTAYLQWARSRGYQVWALVSNDFDIDRTHEFLKNPEARERFIREVVDAALTHGYQGINLDFEHIYMEDRDRLTHFVNELAVALSAHNLILSMDVTVMGGSDNWSRCYDHEALGRIVDYLIIMTYDEYWASSPVSGPVASYGWVERHMKDLTEVVDSRKLVLGLPLYTRIWRETPSTETANRMVTRSSAIGMAVRQTFLEENGLTPIWDEESRLYYASFIDGEQLVKLWIENAETLSIRAGLVEELELGGIACWQRSFATDDVWPALRNVLNRR